LHKQNIANKNSFESFIPQDNPKNAKHFLAIALWSQRGFDLEIGIVLKSQHGLIFPGHCIHEECMSPGVSKGPRS